MKTKILLIFLLAVSFEELSAQQPFIKLFDGDSAYTFEYSILQNVDSSYIVVGSTNCYGAGDFDIYMIKLNPDGDTLWTKTYGTINYEYAESMAKDTNGAGGYVITGSIYDSIAGTNIACLVNIDNYGNLNWVKTYLKKLSFGIYVQQTMDGGFLISGQAVIDSTYDYSALIIKTDNEGNPQWQKTLGSGFTGLDAYGYCSAQDSLGNYYITGYVQSPVTGVDVLVIKLSPEGNIIWSKTYAAINRGETGRFIYPTDDGNFLVLGDITPCGSSDAVSGFYLLKITPSGDTLWTKTYHSYSHPISYNIMKSNDGGYILGCWAYLQSVSRAILIKIDSAGTLLWSKYYINDDINPNGTIGLQSVLSSFDGGFIFCGSYSSSISKCYGLVIKTDSLGNTGCYQNNQTNSIIYTPIIISDKVLPVTNFYMKSSVSLITGSGGKPESLCSIANLPELQRINYNCEVFPNPSSDKIIITNSGKSKIEIINVNGQIIKTFYNNEKEMTIDLSGLSNGIYIVKVINDKAMPAGSYRVPTNISIFVV